MALLLEALLGCARQEQRMSRGHTTEYTQVASAFARALASRDYPAAYAMTSKQYRQETSLEAMRSAFEATVPTDWRKVDPIEVGLTMEDWPGKRAADVGRAYVGLGGDVYSEAVTVVITREEGDLRVRTVEFGRP
jgi:hypothetical protein